MTPPIATEPQQRPTVEVRRAGELVTITVCHCTLGLSQTQARALAEALLRAAR